MKKTEQKPLYIREGRRFVKLGFGYQPNRMDVTGYFYNPDGTFSVSRRDDSIGIVILQTPKERIIAGLKAIRVIDWYNAKEHIYETFNNKGGFPTQLELILINENENIDKHDVEVILGDECSSTSAWGVTTCYYNYGNVSRFTKGGGIYDRGFVPILRIKL